MDAAKIRSYPKSTTFVVAVYEAVVMFFFIYLPVTSFKKMGVLAIASFVTPLAILAVVHRAAAIIMRTAAASRSAW